MSLRNDTIVAVASPPGAGHEAVIRLSGPDAVTIADKFFQGPESIAQTPGFSALAGHIPFGASHSVPATAYIMRSPMTYTREDMVELHVPASTPILQHLVREMIAQGARAAEPGEFTERAFLSGRIDLAQAEAVLRAVHAVRAAELRNAVTQLRGFAHQETGALRERLLALMSLLEINMDFSDQDIELVKEDELHARLAEVRSGIDTITARAARLLPAEGVPVVLYGPPNSGKSTLFNALARAEKAIVSPVPGTTRDYIEARIEAEGITLRLIDTAGIFETADIIEQAAQSRSREHASSSGVLVHVMDICGAGGIMTERQPDVIVLNKADLLSAEECDRRLSHKYPAPVLALSALNNEGLDVLMEAIMETAIPASGAHAFVPNVRQAACLSLARAHVDAADKAGGDELIAYELRSAANALGEVTGEIPTDEILGRIFRQFCVGK